MLALAVASMCIAVVTTTACTGSSAGLPDAECNAWLNLFDHTQGARQWNFCNKNRLDPCACCFPPMGPMCDTKAHTVVTCNANHIVKLALGGNNLNGLIPASLGNLSELETMYMQDNSLTGTIPESLGNLKMLTILQLGGNYLKGPIPESITALPLTRLWLNDNDFTGTIPSNVAKMPLMELRLSGNTLTGVVPSFNFKTIAACELENPPGNATNSFACPLPPNSGLCTLGPPRCK
jgi:hypothetical protein